VLTIALASLLVSDPRPLLVTIDDLPLVNAAEIGGDEQRARVTDEMLRVLAKHHIRAVGLVTGSRVHGPGDRALLEKWIAAGHELGNHSFGHLSYSSTDPDTYLADLERGRKLVEEILRPHKKTVRFFRFPFLREGDTREKLEKARAYLKKTGQRNLPVTIDDQDWSFEKPWLEAAKIGDAAKAEVAREYQVALRLEVERHERIGDKLLGRTAPQILLLHATAVGAAQWDELFAWLEKTGHRFQSANELLADPAFAIEHSYVGQLGYGLWDRIRVERRNEQAKEAIGKLLADQAAAWTRGDLEAFCSVYAEDARFLSPSGVTLGRQAIFDRYKKKFGSAKETMGELGLEIEELRLFFGDEVSILGDAVPSAIHGAAAALRWRLRWANKPEASGLSLITLVPVKDGWRIVQDASM
jgi:peptidoglycan-N-acetylglucosamine deacetylase